MAAGNTYEAISTQTLGSAAASVTFSSIPSTYTDLVCVINGVINTGEEGIVTRVGNGSLDTGSNYSSTYILGSGSSAASGRESNATSILAGRIQDGTYNSTSIIHYMNYSNSTTYKTVLGRGNDSTYVIQHVGLWRSTSAINTIQVFPLSSKTFSTGTVVSLYGIAAA